MIAPSLKNAAATSLMSTPAIRSAMSTGLARKHVDRAVRRAWEAGLTFPGDTNRAVVWRSDRWLRTSYRNHHVFRTALLRSHSLRRGVAVMPEFRVNSSVADIAIASTSVHIVEIKSDLDDLSRLPAQMRDYRKVAPFVSIAAASSTIARIVSDPELNSVGLFELSGAGALVEVRCATPDVASLDPLAMLRSLRRREYLTLLARYDFDLSGLPNTLVFSRAAALVDGLEPERFQSEFAQVLANRVPRAGVGQLKSFPAPLTATLLHLNPTRTALDRLRSWLDEGVDDVLAEAQSQAI